MTLIEVLVALGIFVILLAGIVPTLLSTTTANNRSEQVGVAMRLATNTLEDYRVKLGKVSLPTSGDVSTTVTAQGRTYTVVSTFCPSDAPSTMTCSSNARYIRVVVSLSASTLYRAESFFTQLN